MARETGRWLLQHHPPWLSPHLGTHGAGALGTFSLPAPSRSPTLCSTPEPHVGASPATPHVLGTRLSAHSALPQTGVAKPTPGCQRLWFSGSVTKEGMALARLPLPAQLLRSQCRARALGEDSIYLRSLRAAGAGGHQRSGSSGHSASRRAPREWGPPARQTRGSKGFPVVALFAPTDTTHYRKFPRGLLDTDS